MYKSKVVERKHAILSASGSSRWINCTPSPRLEEQVEDEQTSVYAAEGTLAHEFAELKLRGSLKAYLPNACKRILETLQANALYTSDMESEVEKYTSYVLEQLRTAPSGTFLLIEEKFDPTRLSHNELLEYIKKLTKQKDNVGKIRYNKIINFIQDIMDSEISR